MTTVSPSKKSCNFCSLCPGKCCTVRSKKKEWETVIESDSSSIPWVWHLSHVPPISLSGHVSGNSSRTWCLDEDWEVNSSPASCHRKGRGPTPTHQRLTLECDICQNWLVGVKNNKIITCFSRANVVQNSGIYGNHLDIFAHTWTQTTRLRTHSRPASVFLYNLICTSLVASW